MKSMIIPKAIRKPVQKYLALADRNLPETIVAFYIVGSVALGDYRDGLSDIDFVAVCDRPYSADELSKTEGLHQTLAEEFVKPDFDGVYVLRDQLRNVPDGTGIASYQGGVLLKEKAFNVNPVTWHLLKLCPVSVRGNPQPDVYNDTAALRAWCKGNIRGYWGSWTENAIHQLTNPIDADDVDIVWGVLGITRLHATIASGEVISKSGAAVYAKQTFDPKWHDLVDDVAAARKNRNDQAADFSVNQKMTAMEYMEHVIADALT